MTIFFRSHDGPFGSQCSVRNCGSLDHASAVTNQTQNTRNCAQLVLFVFIRTVTACLNRRLFSNKHYLDCGVPQGSCLGPLLCTIYTSKLFDIIEKHLPRAHSFTDDGQLLLLDAWCKENVFSNLPFSVALYDMATKEPVQLCYLPIWL